MLSSLDEALLPSTAASLPKVALLNPLTFHYCFFAKGGTPSSIHNLSLGWCSSLGFATEADADASGSTSTEDQASYASASFAAPFPDGQPTG
ncbi:hypothetical protein ZIOFF_048257 [Zingiber officinale]|uniref:Uncharacterized protein n=1 Tax=Zingiber officinale TaxID=94328 RepID=A0A8J5KWI2_ZINOF|nr:hypothetical protein ZIOFF_048257 [Zingiber officinale]